MHTGESKKQRKKKKKAGKERGMKGKEKEKKVKSLSRVSEPPGRWLPGKEGKGRRERNKKGKEGAEERKKWRAVWSNWVIRFKTEEVRKSTLNIIMRNLGLILWAVGSY